MESDDVQGLRDKIQSKMEVAKFFSGFVSLVFGVVLKDWWVSLRIALLQS